MTCCGGARAAAVDDAGPCSGERSMQGAGCMRTEARTLVRACVIGKACQRITLLRYASFQRKLLLLGSCPSRTSCDCCPCHSVYCAVHALHGSHHGALPMAWTIQNVTRCRAASDLLPIPHVAPLAARHCPSLFCCQPSVGAPCLAPNRLTSRCLHQSRRSSNMQKAAAAGFSSACAKLASRRHSS